MRVRRSATANEAPRLMAVVVFPTPPFWFAMAMTRDISPLDPARGDFWGKELNIFRVLLTGNPISFLTVKYLRDDIRIGWNRFGVLSPKLTKNKDSLLI